MKIKIKIHWKRQLLALAKPTARLFITMFLLWLILACFIWVLLLWSLFASRFINKWDNIIIIFFFHIAFVRWFAAIIITWGWVDKIVGWPATDIYGNKGIFIEFLGRAHCHWTEGSGSKKETYSGTEIYMDERRYLFGGRTGESCALFPHFCPN